MIYETWIPVPRKGVGTLVHPFGPAGHPNQRLRFEGLYVSGELSRRRLAFSKSVTVYASQNNPGAVAAAHALLSAATFHFTYNVLRLHKDGIIGWQVVTIPLGVAAFKKLCELMYAKDLLGESPYKCT